MLGHRGELLLAGMMWTLRPSGAYICRPMTTVGGFAMRACAWHNRAAREVLRWSPLASVEVARLLGSSGHPKVDAFSVSSFALLSTIGWLAFRLARRSSAIRNPRPRYSIAESLRECGPSLVLDTGCLF